MNIKPLNIKPHLLELRELLEERGFTVSGLDPGISFYRNTSVYLNERGQRTYPNSEAYSFDAKQSSLLLELLSEI